MKQVTYKPLALRIVIFASSLLLLLFFLAAFCSFKTARFTDDFLKQLGITKESADSRINSSLLAGGLNYYGLKNAKDIALGNRRAVMLDALAYAKGYANSAAFAKKYNDMKEMYRPKEEVPKTPEQVKAETIEQVRKSVTELEASVKKADANTKEILEGVLKSSRQQLKQYEDPSNQQFAMYARNYPELVKTLKSSYASQLAQWEKKYPANQLLYVKVRLQEFMETTKDIDFTAELTTKNNGKKYFVNPAYERKSSHWKMAFRAGKEVVEPAREFVQKWIEEIK